jgi:hypothetical protein
MPPRAKPSAKRSARVADTNEYAVEDGMEEAASELFQQALESGPMPQELKQKLIAQLSTLIEEVREGGFTRRERHPLAKANEG